MMFQRLKKLLEKKPPEPAPEWRHPELGVLTCEEGLWSGTTRRDNRDIPFTVGGTYSCPDTRLVSAFLSLLDHFAETERNARQFLCPAEASVTVDDFTFQCVNFLCTDRPARFTFEFALQGDPYAIWRVELEDGKPKYTGRDD